jgi:hypothetical protein
VKPLLLGLLLGAVVVCDPLITTYLLRDFSWLHDLPYLLSITVALTVGVVFAARAFAPGLGATVLRDYWRYFPLLFLVAHQFSGVTVGTFDPTEVVLGVFILLFFAGLFTHRDQRFVSTPFNMLHLAISICIAVSLVSTFRPIALLKTFKYFVEFFLLVNFLPRREDLCQTFLKWLVILAVPSAAFALVQEAVWLSAHIALTPVPPKELEIQVEDHFGVRMYRVAALMVSYHNLALYLATALFLAISALLWRKEAALLPPRWLIVSVCVISPALFLTFSNPMYVALSAGLPLLVLARWPARGAFFAVVGGLVGALVLVGAIAIVPGKVDTAVDVARTVPKAEIERIRLDRDTIEGFLHGPYFWTGRGVGSGNRYTVHSRGWPAHNAFILAAAELGVFGLILYLMIWGLFIARVVALNIVVKGGPYLFFVRALPAILFLFLVALSFHGYYFDNLVWPIFALAEALWFKVRTQSRATAESRPTLSVSPGSA